MSISSHIKCACGHVYWAIGISPVQCPECKTVPPLFSTEHPYGESKPKQSNTVTQMFPNPPGMRITWIGGGIRGTRKELFAWGFAMCLGCYWWIENLDDEAVLWMIDMRPFGFKTVRPMHSGTDYLYVHGMWVSNGAPLPILCDLKDIADRPELGP